MASRIFRHRRRDCLMATPIYLGFGKQRAPGIRWTLEQTSNLGISHTNPGPRRSPISVSTDRMRKRIPTRTVCRTACPELMVRFHVQADTDAGIGSDSL